MWFSGYMEWLDKESLGPKMLALSSDQQRLFVWWMANGAPTVAAAARAAGYSNVKEGAKVRGCVLMQQPAILEALHETAGKTMRSLAPLAITKAKRILENEAHPAHSDMIKTIMDRSGHSAKTEHKVTVEHTVDMKELEALARRLAQESGVPVQRLLGSDAKVIDGTAQEVNPVSRETTDQE
jgi:phage terminase small subunit